MDTGSDEIMCDRPCHPDEGCTACLPYWQRMEAEGYWKNGEWTAKGIKEMCK